MMHIYPMAMALFLVLNPLGNIPVFITTLQHVPPKRRYWVIFRECSFALIILAFAILQIVNRLFLGPTGVT